MNIQEAFFGSNDQPLIKGERLIEDN